MRSLTGRASLSAASLRSFCELRTPQYRWDLAHLDRVMQTVLPPDRAPGQRFVAISIPPRHGKSELVTKHLPAAWIDAIPGSRVILTAYNESLALEFSEGVRDLTQKPLSRTKHGLKLWKTQDGCSVRAAGVGGGITGRGADLFLIDDPIKSAEEAYSPTYRERLWNWLRMDAITRLSPNATMVLVMTRWHADDLVGRIQANPAMAARWLFLNLPAIALDDDPLGRPRGAALWPDQWDLAYLEGMLAILGPTRFAALYQGSPVPDGGSIYRRELFQHYTDLPAGPHIIVQSWDTAEVPGDGHAYSVCTTWADYTTGAAYLLHRWKDRVGYIDLEHAARSLAAQWKPQAILVEDKSSGRALIDSLKGGHRRVGPADKRPASLPVVAITPDTDKVVRSAVETPAYETHQIWHPVNAEWLADYETQLVGFPATEYLDDADSTSQFLKWRRTRSVTGWAAVTGKTVTRAPMGRGPGRGGY